MTSIRDVVRSIVAWSAQFELLLMLILLIRIVHLLCLMRLCLIFFQWKHVEFNIYALRALVMEPSGSMNKVLDIV